MSIKLDKLDKLIIFYQALYARCSSTDRCTRCDDLLPLFTRNVRIHYKRRHNSETVFCVLAR